MKDLNFKHSNEAQKTPDPQQEEDAPQETMEATEKALELLAESDRQFQNHWLWESLKCTPEEFFESFQAQMNESLTQTQTWKDALERAQCELNAQVQSIKQQAPSPSTFLRYGALPV